MKPIQAVWLIISCLFSYAAAVPTQGQVQLHIHLRDSDGTAASGETVILERLPASGQAQAEGCMTNAMGQCSWLVTPGLYQVRFNRPLDDLSALALAEGGLDGFGLTVGEGDISYHFTFSDGRVYFDAAPDAAVPAPIIPEPDDMPVWPRPTPTGTADAAPPLESTTIPSVGVTTTQGGVTDRRWRPVYFILLGVGLGGGLYLLQPRLARVWSRKQPKTADKRPSQTTSEEKEA